MIGCRAVRCVVARRSQTGAEHMDNPDDDPQLDIVAQCWPAISVDEADAVLQLLTQPCHALNVVAQSGRPTAAGAMIHVDNGPDLFIKRYDRSVRDADTILPYHRFVAWLARHGIATPEFLPFRQGGRLGDARDVGIDGGDGSDSGGDSVDIACVDDVTVLAAGRRIYEVCRRARGQDRYVDAVTWDPVRNIAQARELGVFVARIASAAEGFRIPHVANDPFQNRFGLLPVLAVASDRHEVVARWLRERPRVARYIVGAERDLLRDLEPCRAFAAGLVHDYATLPPCWTHGDPHCSNFLWEGDGPVSVIDFGLAAQNTAIFDLVMAIERHCIPWVGIVEGKAVDCRVDMARAIVAGWSSVRPLRDAERRVVVQMLPICQVEAALNWIGYYMRDVQGREDADWCYDVMFRQHVAWFYGEQGRAFLDDIRRIVNGAHR